MATEILAAGTSEVYSNWYTAAADERVSLLLKPATGAEVNMDSILFVQYKTSAGNPVRAYAMGRNSPLAVVFIGPLEWRIYRPTLPTWASTGVERA